MVRRATWFASHRLWPAGGASSICREWQTDFLALLGCGAFICLVGLLDDIWRLSAWKKLIAQFAGALVKSNRWARWPGGGRGGHCLRRDRSLCAHDRTTGDDNADVGAPGESFGFFDSQFQPGPDSFMGDSGSMFLGVMIAGSSAPGTSG